MPAHAPFVQRSLVVQALPSSQDEPSIAGIGSHVPPLLQMPTWQLAMSATDANRFVLLFARHLTGRPRIAVMDWCYHGTVDETLAVLDGDRVVPRPGALGPQVDVAETTAVVPFNDLDALDRRLAEASCLNFHPLPNTAPTSVDQAGFRAFLAASGVTPLIVDFAAMAVVA